MQDMTFLYTKIFNSFFQMYVEIQRKKIETWNTPKHDHTKDQCKNFIIDNDDDGGNKHTTIYGHNISRLHFCCPCMVVVMVNSIIAMKTTIPKKKFNTQLTILVDLSSSSKYISIS